MNNDTIKITSITLHKTSIGDQIAITYAVIGENGNVISQNKRAEKVVTSDILDTVNSIYGYALSCIEESN